MVRLTKRTTTYPRNGSVIAITIAAAFTSLVLTFGFATVALAPGHAGTPPAAQNIEATVPADTAAN